MMKRLICALLALLLALPMGLACAEELRGYSDWTALLGVIDTRLAEAVDRLEAALAEGGL